MAFHRRAALASLAIACAHACGALTYAAQAQEPTAAEPQAPPSTTVSLAAPPESESERKERAQERFDRGRALYDKQAWGAALAEFSEARKILPTWSSTAWVAQCLKNLARFDEAFDMYAILVNEYGDTLPAAAKQRALEEVESMRKLVGTIEIEGAIPGSAIYVDRQARGEYPLLAPLRVAAGSHFVKVFVEGYEPFETRIDVAGSTTARVVAILRKLDATGILRVVEQQNRTLDVVVDGIVLGKTPLSLRIAPGEHVVFLRGEEMLGTLPARVEVHGDNDAPLRLIAEPLEAELELKLEPFDALVAIDSVTLGKGMWSGRVKPGQHTVEVAAPGFLPDKRQVITSRAGKQVVIVKLERDPKSPFWRRPEPPPHWLVEFGLGVPLVPSIGGVGDSCGEGCSEIPGFGINPAVRAGFELGTGLSFGASVGYFQFLQSIDERTATAQVIGRSGNVGTADDELGFRGFSVGAWGGYSFGEKIRIHARLGAGFIVGSFADIRNGSFEDNDGNPYAVGPLEQFQTQSFFHLTSELRVGYRLTKHWEIVSGLEIPLLFPLSTLVWNPTQGFTAGTDGYGYFSSEALTGSPFAVMLPSLALRYDFR